MSSMIGESKKRFSHHEGKTESVEMRVAPEVRDRLRNVLINDERMRGVGYSEFVDRALDIVENGEEYVTPEPGGHYHDGEGDCFILAEVLEDGSWRGRWSGVEREVTLGRHVVQILGFHEQIEVRVS